MSSNVSIYLQAKQNIRYNHTIHTYFSTDCRHYWHIFHFVAVGYSSESGVQVVFGPYFLFQDCERKTNCTSTKFNKQTENCKERKYSHFM